MVLSTEMDAVSDSSRPDGLIRLDGVHKVYQMGLSQVHALAGVNVTFERNSFWAVMGPSGSGKSTLLNLLGCLDRPSSGRYTLSGQDVSLLGDDDLSELRLRQLGFIFQSFNLIPQLTVQENIELPLYYLGWESARSAQRARELAELIGLQDRLGHRPMELSGGQQQRVAIARALVKQPAIVLADEPTANLDSGTGEEILHLMQNLNEKHGTTFVFLTHDPMVMDHAKRLVQLHDGQITSDERR